MSGCVECRNLVVAMRKNGETLELALKLLANPDVPTDEKRKLFTMILDCAESMKAIP